MYLLIPNSHEIARYSSAYAFSAESDNSLFHRRAFSLYEDFLRVLTMNLYGTNTGSGGLISELIGIAIAGAVIWLLFSPRRRSSDRLD
jgi:hypothetical protein